MEKLFNLLKTEKANKFFRIGFFVILILFLFLSGLTIYTRIIPNVDNPLSPVTVEQQLKIDSLSQTIENLNQLNENQQKSIFELEKVDFQRTIHIQNIKDIINSSVSSIQNMKDANEKVRSSFQLILQIIEEVEKINKE